MTEKVKTNTNKSAVKRSMHRWMNIDKLETLSDLQLRAKGFSDRDISEIRYVSKMNERRRAMFEEERDNIRIQIRAYVFKAQEENRPNQ